MCGRFVLKTPFSDLVRLYNITTIGLNLEPRYNIAPTLDIAVVRSNPETGRTLDMLRWGLVPWWAKDTKIDYSTINAKAETIAGNRIGWTSVVRRQQVLEAYATPFTPAAIDFNGTLWLFWTANDGSGDILAAPIADNFQGPGPRATILNAGATNGPVACLFEINGNTLLYLFWTAGETISFSFSGDGRNWSAPAVVNPTFKTTQAPAACEFNGQFYLFWSDSQRGNEIVFSSSPDGATWD